MNENDPAPPPQAGWLRTLVALVLIPVFDVLLLVGGAVSMLTLIWQIVVRLPWELLNPQSPERRRHRLRRAGLYVAVAAASLGITRIDGAIAEQRADRIVAALKAYRTEHGRYPESLDELVPKHLDAVPAAHPLALSQDRFSYRRLDGRADATPRPPMFLYILAAPMSWTTYDFEDNQWRLRD